MLDASNWHVACGGQVQSSEESVTPKTRRGFTRQPESPNVHIGRSRCFKHHQNSTRRPRERKRAKMGAREGKNNAKCWAVGRLAPTLRAPTLGALTFPRSGPHPSGPHPTLRAPTPPGPPLRAPTLRAEALRASTLCGFGPLRSSFLTCCSFVLFLCIFNCFCFLSFFDFFEIVTVFVFVGFFFF